MRSRIQGLKNPQVKVVSLRKYYLFLSLILLVCIIAYTSHKLFKLASSWAYINITYDSCVWIWFLKWILEVVSSTFRTDRWLFGFYKGHGQFHLSGKKAKVFHLSAQQTFKIFAFVSENLKPVYRYLFGLDIILSFQDIEHLICALYCNLIAIR